MCGRRPRQQLRGKENATATTPRPLSFSTPYVFSPVTVDVYSLYNHHLQLDMTLAYSRSFLFFRIIQNRMVMYFNFSSASNLSLLNHLLISIQKWGYQNLTAIYIWFLWLHLCLIGFSPSLRVCPTVIANNYCNLFRYCCG